MFSSFFIPYYILSIFKEWFSVCGGYIILCNIIKDPDLNVGLPSPEKLDFRNKPFNYDIYFIDKTFQLPQCEHERLSRIQLSWKKELHISR